MGSPNEAKINRTKTIKEARRNAQEARTHKNIERRANGQLTPWETAKKVSLEKMIRRIERDGKGVPRSDLGFLVRRSVVNGETVTTLEYPGKKAVEEAISGKHGMDDREWQNVLHRSVWNAPRSNKH